MGPEDVTPVAPVNALERMPTPVVFPTGRGFVEMSNIKKSAAPMVGWLSRTEFASLADMQLAASEVRRRARYHLFRGGSSESMTQGVVLARRYRVLFFQAAATVFLAVRGFPGERVLAHALVVVFYALACFYPGPPVTERRKARMIGAGGPG
jgi:hypothetical protein